MDKTKLVVKDNALIDASFYLSLVEQRLILLGITQAREKEKLTIETAIRVSVKSYQNQFNVSSSTAYESLQDASNTLFDRQFSYYDSDLDERFKERWIYKASYMDNKGHVILFFTPTVIKMISRLEENFTKYMLDQIAGFKSKYSIRIYELIAKWLSVGNTQKYEINHLREMLGVNPDEYKTMSLFKVNVLDKAIKEISQKSNLTVEYEQFKNGRVITHVQFKIKSKDEPCQEKKLKPLTAKQIDMYADKLSKLQSFQSHFVADMGQSADDYSKNIASKLQDGFYQNEWLSFLIDVGFKPRYAK